MLPDTLTHLAAWFRAQSVHGGVHLNAAACELAACQLQDCAEQAAALMAQPMRPVPPGGQAAASVAHIAGNVVSLVEARRGRTLGRTGADWGPAA